MRNLIPLPIIKREWRARLRGVALAVCVSLTFAVPAQANPFQASQNTLNAVQLADALSISKMTWKGDAAYDQTAPACAKTAIREFACQGIAIVAIRMLEKPSKGTMIANYIAAAAYTWYIHRAVGATILSVKF